jgi:uncharacterized protein (DUF342 family)
MVKSPTLEIKFGDIAIKMQLLSKVQLERALVVQEIIFIRTKVHMAIGKVLKEMGILTQLQIDSVLDAQMNLTSKHSDGDEDDRQRKLTENKPESKDNKKGFNVTIPKDKLSAFISPKGPQSEGMPLEAVKALLAERGVVFGLVEDHAIESYLTQKPLPIEPFKVADGVPPTPGKPPEIIYHYDTDPLRIGTLMEDGTMDWKDRGQIPQAIEGDILVEKTKGDPGRPGTTVFGNELSPPRLRDPKLKCGKGAQRSEDGNQILAKISGIPRLCSDGKVYVFGVLNIDGDIGVETGHIEFDGHIETTGGVSTGYSVKGKGLRTAEIQDATIELEQDLECHGGIYGSTIKVGGHLKASHIHNCTIEVLGELVVEKEIYDSTIETNGRCLIVEGKLIDTKIDAKKGIYAKDIGSEGSTPCELTVGFDRKYERDLAGSNAVKNELERKRNDSEAALSHLKEELETIDSEIKTFDQEWNKYQLQKHQFEEQLRGEGPNPLGEDDVDERRMLEEMIAELVEKNNDFEAKNRAMAAEKDTLCEQLADVEKQTEMLAQLIEKTEGKIEILKSSHKFDPGISVVKANGTLFDKTQIIGPHKQITIEKDLRKVRIAESKVESTGNKYQIKISNLR